LSEAVHIYDNQTTPFDWTFAAEDFVVPLGTAIIDVGDAKYTGTAAEIRTAIQNDFDGLIAVNNIVKFIGTRTNGAFGLALNIPAGKEVEWEATFGTGASGSSLIDLTEAGTLNVNGGTLTASGEYAAIYNGGAGTVNIKSGTVVNTANNVAVSNTGTGTVNVSGGTVSCTGIGYAIYNYSTGEVNISGGLVTSKRSANTNSGTITNIGAATINITGGIVENTAASTEANRRAIQNSASGTINITDGLVQLTEGAPSYGGISSAIRNVTGGEVNVAYPWVDDVALVVPYPTDTIDVTSKTVVNISTEYTEKIAWFNTIYFTGTSNTSGAQLSLNIPEGKTVNWEATVSGSVSTSVILLASASRGTFNVTGGSIQNSGGGSSIHSDSPGTIIVSGGTVRHTANGVAISNKGNGTVNVTSGLVTSATNSTTFGTIENDGTGKINVSGGTVSNTSTAPAIWNAGTGTVVTVSGTANVTGASTYGTIYNTSTGTVNVEGGTVTGGTEVGRTIVNNSTGTINVSGGTVTSATNSTTSGTIRNVSGTVNISGGTVQNTAVATAADRIAIHNVDAGATVNVTGGLVQLTVEPFGSIQRAIRGGIVTVTPPGVVIPWN